MFKLVSLLGVEVFVEKPLCIFNAMTSKYSKIFHFDVVRKLQHEIKESDTVLDLGCGWNSLLQYCKPKYSIGVDSYEYYLQISKEKEIHSEYIHGNFSEMEFEPKSFDVVLCAQVLEHFTKEEGYKVIDQMEKWAKRKVIITTPNGFLKKTSFDENELQEHLSGWTTYDLKRMGFRVRGSSGFKIIRQKCKPTIIWRAVFNVSSMITCHFPKQAFQLFAVKEISKNG